MNKTGEKCRQIRAAASKFETREETGEMYISGYFSVFNSVYEMWPGAKEQIEGTAFDDTINDDIRCLTNHDTRLVLGRTKAGTLNLKIDNKGLWGEVRINPNDRDAVNLYERVKRGDVDQCSIGFEVLEEAFEELGDYVQWTILKVKLYEVSIVTFPAYEDTSVTAREKDLKEIKKRKNEEWKAKMLKKVKGE